MLASLITASGFGQAAPTPGVLDATSFDFNENRLNLSGTWLWFDGRLLSPAQAKALGGLPVEFPGVWNDRRESGNGQGYATYSLTVLLPSRSKDFSIDLPQIYSSYVLFVNGEEAARNGTPGTTSQTTKPQWMPQIVPLHITGDTVNFTLQISNFNHYKGGCKETISLGATPTFSKKGQISMIGKMVSSSLIVILAIAFIGVFFKTGRKRVVMYFSLLCVTWAIRSVFSNDYLAITLFPDFSWEAMVRIEYITLYLTMIWAILFLYRLFKNEGNQVVKYLLVTFNSGFIIYTVATEPVEFTRLLPLYLVAAGVLLVYGAGVVLVALINERKGATYLTLSVMLGLSIFSYDIFTYEGWFSYNSLLFSIGYLAIFVLMGGALLLHLGVIKSASTTTTMLTYKDLYGDS